MEKHFNFNTLLLLVLVGGGGWLGTEVVWLDKQVSSLASTQKVINENRDLQVIELRDRLRAIEVRLTSIEMKGIR